MLGRETEARSLENKLRDARISDGHAPIEIAADSVEEAVGFVAAVVSDHDDLAAVSVVVSSEEGWRYVSKNSGIRVAIAASPEIAKRPPLRSVSCCRHTETEQFA